MRSYWAILLPVVCSGIACGPAPVATPPAPEQPKVEVAPEPRPVETVDDLVRTINDDPSPRHFHRTASGDKLIELGDVAIPRVLDLMLDDDEWTRKRAQQVLGAITMKQHGFVLGRGWTDPEQETRWRTFWNSLGPLKSEAPREERERAVKLWRKWLASRKA